MLPDCVYLKGGHFCLNMYPKSKPKEGEWVGGLGLCREVIFFYSIILFIVKCMYI